MVLRNVRSCSSAGEQHFGWMLDREQEAEQGEEKTPCSFTAVWPSVPEERRQLVCWDSAIFFAALFCDLLQCGAEKKLRLEDTADLI